MNISLDANLHSFLSHRPRIGRIGVALPDGSPWVQPVWFLVDGDQIWFNITGDSRLGRSLRRDPRVTLCVDDDDPPYAFAALQGRMAIVDDDAALRDLLATQVERYRPDIATPADYVEELLAWEPFLGRMEVHRAYYEAKESK